MTHPIDPVDLISALIAVPSVTPATGAVFDVLEAALAPLGFAVLALRGLAFHRLNLSRLQN